jgi:hypothetical protein
MRGLIFILSAFVWSALPGHAWALDWSDCNQREDADLKIRSCTRIIDSGEREHRDGAYNNRGVAYDMKG